MKYQKEIEELRSFFLERAINPDRPLNKDEFPAVIHNLYYGEKHKYLSPLVKLEIVRELLSEQKPVEKFLDYYKDLFERFPLKELTYKPHNIPTFNDDVITIATKTEKVTNSLTGIATLYKEGNTLSNREIIYRRDGRKCLACGTNKTLTLDHIVPVSKGGKNDLDNLQTLCKKCNLEKGARIRDYRKQKK